MPEQTTQTERPSADTSSTGAPAAAEPAPQKQRSAPPRSKADRDKLALSKLLSKILRHKAADFGLKLRPDGFARLSDVLALPGVRKAGGDFDAVKSLVAADAKTRFALRHASELDDAALASAPDSGAKDGGSATDADPVNWYIRANQGHSIAAVDDLELVLIIPADRATDSAPGAGRTCPIPHTVLHGTYRKVYIDHIRTQGLSRMRRNHIHLATGLPASFGGPHAASGGVAGAAASSKDDIVALPDDAAPPITTAAAAGAANASASGSTGAKESAEPAVRSGVRANTDTFIHIDVGRAIADGLAFYKSANGVILTAGDKDGYLKPVYFSRVVDRVGRSVE